MPKQKKVKALVDTSALEERIFVGFAAIQAMVQELKAARETVELEEETESPTINGQSTALTKSHREPRHVDTGSKGWHSNGENGSNMTISTHRREAPRPAASSSERYKDPWPERPKMHEIRSLIMVDKRVWNYMNLQIRQLIHRHFKDVESKSWRRHSDVERGLLISEIVKAFPALGGFQNDWVPKAMAVKRLNAMCDSPHSREIYHAKVNNEIPPYKRKKNLNIAQDEDSDSESSDSENINAEKELLGAQISEQPRTAQGKMNIQEKIRTTVESCQEGNKSVARKSAIGVKSTSRKPKGTTSKISRPAQNPTTRTQALATGKSTTTIGSSYSDHNGRGDDSTSSEYSARSEVESEDEDEDEDLVARAPIQQKRKKRIDQVSSDEDSDVQPQKKLKQANAAPVQAEPKSQAMEGQSLLVTTRPVDQQEETPEENSENREDDNGEEENSVWSREALPSRRRKCPDPMCDNMTPTKPSAKILTLFDIFEQEDPRKNEETWWRAAHNVCVEITKENNLEVYSDYCHSQGWPVDIPWLKYRERIIQLKPRIDEIVRDPEAYVDTAAWIHLTAIVKEMGMTLKELGYGGARSYRLYPIMSKTRVGYFGEVGEEVIQHTVDAFYGGPYLQKIPKQVYSPMSAEAFTRFFLVPFVASCLIAEDTNVDSDMAIAIMVDSSLAGYSLHETGCYEDEVDKWKKLNERGVFTEENHVQRIITGERPRPRQRFTTHNTKTSAGEQGPSDSIESQPKQETESRDECKAEMDTGSRAELDIGDKAEDTECNVPLYTQGTDISARAKLHLLAQMAVTQAPLDTAPNTNGGTQLAAKVSSASNSNLRAPPLTNDLANNVSIQKVAANDQGLANALNGALPLVPPSMPQAKKKRTKSTPAAPSRRNPPREKKQVEVTKPEKPAKRLRK